MKKGNLGTRLIIAMAVCAWIAGIGRGDGFKNFLYAVFTYFMIFMAVGVCALGGIKHTEEY